MTLPTVPRAYYDGGNLDVEAVNENLRAFSRNIRRNMDLRYSTTSFVVSLDGMADTDGSGGGRRFRLEALTLSSSVSWQIIGAEMVVYAAAGVTWTLSCTADAAWPGVSVATAGTTTEATASTNKPMAVSAIGLDFLFTASQASTITRGYVVFTLLCDRGQQNNASFVGYTPTLLSSATSTAGSTLDTELTNAAAAVTQETNAQIDIRVMCFSTRNLASGQTVTMRIPSGRRTGGSASNALNVVACAPVGATITGTIASSSLSATAPAAGAGVTTFAVGNAALTAADANTPSVQASDITLTIARGADGGAVAPLCYLVVWFV